MLSEKKKHALYIVGGVVVGLAVIFGLVVLIRYLVQCKSCENGCEFDMGKGATCKCDGCKNGTTCDKQGKCACPTACQLPNGVCEKDGSCSCKNNYSGSDCTVKPCDPACKAPGGVCTDGECQCQNGYKSPETNCVTPPSAAMQKLIKKNESYGENYAGPVTLSLPEWQEYVASGANTLEGSGGVIPGGTVQTAGGNSGAVYSGHVFQGY